MLPIETVFSRLARVVRDITAKQDEQVDFVIMGKDPDLHRSAIGEIGDPVLHLIRNSVDHGLDDAQTHGQCEHDRRYHDADPEALTSRHSRWRCPARRYWPGCPGLPEDCRRRQWLAASLAGGFL
jgi:hypothetical protein